MSRLQGGTISLKRAGLCEYETVRYGELDRQSYVPFWTAYPPLGRSPHHSKKERFPGGGSPSCYPLRGLGAFFPRKGLKSPAIRGPTCSLNPGASDRINSNYFIILKYNDHGRLEKKNPATEQWKANKTIRQQRCYR